MAQVLEYFHAAAQRSFKTRFTKAINPLILADVIVAMEPETETQESPMFTLAAVALQLHDFDSRQSVIKVPTLAALLKPS